MPHDTQHGPLKEATPCTRNIAVIGGGAKAAALAAKARVLSDQQKADIRITLFEAREIGANWRGDAGYTDGEQRLCTLAERDVGYPYASMFGRDVDVAMATDYAWGRYLVSQNKGFSGWVDSGRKPPRHKDFAAYLAWVVDRAQPTTVMAKVTALARDKHGLWRVTHEDGHGVESTSAMLFDAVVVTGPGSAKHVPLKVRRGGSAPRDRMFDGSDFWLRHGAVQACLASAQQDNQYDAADPIVIVGAGGTAAAILAWLVANGAQDLPILMIASQASLYTRVDSVFENRLFSDDAQWSTLSDKSKQAFFDRLNRGVVWNTVMDRVSAATNFTMVDGRAERVTVSASNELAVTVRRGDGQLIAAKPSMLIDASGFDAWWFLQLFKPLTTEQKGDIDARGAWAKSMSNSLCFTAAPWHQLPPVHAPTLSSQQGPGFGSLMVLGAMTDRILKPYT